MSAGGFPLSPPAQPATVNTAVTHPARIIVPTTAIVEAYEEEAISGVQPSGGVRGRQVPGELGMAAMRSARPQPDPLDRRARRDPRRPPRRRPPSAPATSPSLAGSSTAPDNPPCACRHDGHGPTSTPTRSTSFAYSVPRPPDSAIAVWRTAKSPALPTLHHTSVASTRHGTLRRNTNHTATPVAATITSTRPRDVHQASVGGSRLVE